MPEGLFARIAAMDLRRPYVWRLRISRAEFDALEAAVAAGTTTALQNVVYLAEWYKRRYDGGTAKPIREFVARELFEASGIDPVGNLFETESGKSWQYSIYVLGGVAIPFELGKKDARFLKELCKIYYGEEGDVDNLDVKDKARAFAFRESVRTRGSLYEYIRAVLSDEKPFAEEDLADKGSQVNAFVERIKSANDEVLKSKFELEWLFKFDPNAAYMRRMLRLVLRPESLGGLNHRYLNFARVRQWGVVPETCKRLVIGVRFLQGNVPVQEPDFNNPIVDFSTTGSREAGFVAWGIDRWSRRIDVPVTEFDGVEIVARDESGAERLVEKFRIEPWMQVFRVPDGYNEWTSRPGAQRDSALVCTSGCEIETEDDESIAVPSEVYRKRFWGKDGVLSAEYQWRQIIDKVKFADPAGDPHSLYNRQGYDQIVAWPHRELLRYKNGLVRYVEERDGEQEESYLPLIFGRSDLIVRHFETKSDFADEPEGTNTDYEKIEFKDGNGYREWTDAVKPPQGKLTLRITIRGVQRKFVAYHLPMTIERDCRHHRIVCGGEVIEDVPVFDGVPTDPVIYKSFGTDDEFVSLEIWRPTAHKEIIRDGKVVRYVENGETAEISYLLKDDLVIHDFDEQGYRVYPCSLIGGIYSLPEFSSKDKSNSIAYEKAISVNVADSLDASAPDWLWINLAAKFKKDDSVKLLYWDFLPGTETRAVHDDSQCGRDDVVFHGADGYAGLNILSCKVSRPNPFSKTGKTIRANLVQCFEVATAQKAYYFHWIPFKLPKVDMKTELYEPLLTKRGGELTASDRQGLARLAEELGFDWENDYGISI